MSILPDELWRRVLELGIKTGGWTYKDLCCISISCRRLRKLSNEESPWRHLLLSDFPSDCDPSLSCSTSQSKALYRNRYERDRERKLAAHIRAVLRKESQIGEHSRKLRAIESRLAKETENVRATIVELSNLGKVREASVALKVWQPEVIRGRQKQIVEQCVVPVESRVHALQMELRLCKQQISGFEKALKEEKQRLDTAKEELESIKYHPVRDYKSSSAQGQESNRKRKRKSQKTPLV
ncbi:F-box protein SKIP24 [Morella rubra]|uniref:F-box protein SKIP24 n=1 Tax=Morella rubra TaxID=262757 RepID=A0A6A1WFF4_9ROSI|nr:F-box protein SKIP24 [Morella rubra]